MKTRQEAVNVARTWLGTPYVKRQRCKGAGVDCGQLLAGYLIEIQAVTEGDVQEYGPYGSDWFHHTRDELYLKELMKFGKLIAETKCRGGQSIEPGNLVLFRAVGSKVFNHGAIITAWPLGIHANRGGVCETDLICDPLTSFKEMAVFDPWGKP
jgi:cell wall-associated NlpC family hydrolase